MITVTVVGSLNMDLCVETGRFPKPGETILGRTFRQTPGGKGANQACALARLGAAVQLIGCVGDDALGREISTNLSSFGAGLDGLILRRDSPSGVAFILVEDRGENQIIVVRGANATLSADDIHQHAALIRQSRAVVAQLEVPLPAVEAALAIGRAGRALTILNPAPAQPLGDELLKLCDWIIPNETEAARLIGQPAESRDARQLSAMLRRRSPGMGVVVTLGAAGAWLDHDEEQVLIPAFPVQAVDTVGAGDAFVGAFAARMVEGARAKEAVEFAAAAAALAVTRVGAQAGLPTRAEVENLLRR